MKSLLNNASAIDFVAQQFRHGKTLLALGASKGLFDRTGVAASLANGDPDPGVLRAGADAGASANAAFIAAIGKHRHPARETDPPRV